MAVKTALYAVMALQSEINPRLLNIMRELAGGSIIMLPSSEKDFDNAGNRGRSGTLYRLARISLAPAHRDPETGVGLDRHRIRRTA